MLKNNIIKLGLITALGMPTLSVAGDYPATVEALAVKACEHIIKLDYGKLLPYSTDDTKYTFNHYIGRFSKMDKSYLDKAVDSMSGINCDKDTHVNDIGLGNYRVTVKGIRSFYEIVMINNKPTLSDFK